MFHYVSLTEKDLNLPFLKKLRYNLYTTNYTDLKYMFQWILTDMYSRVTITSNNWNLCPVSEFFAYTKVMMVFSYDFFFLEA